MVRMGPVAGVGEGPTSKLASSRHLTSPLTVPRELRRCRLAWRSPPTRSHGGSQGFKSPHLHPQHSQVRASPASSGRRSLHGAAALRPRAQGRSPARKALRDQATRLGPLTMTTERGRRLQPELRIRCDTRQSEQKPHWLTQMVVRSRIRRDGQTRPLLAVWLPAAPTHSTKSLAQTQRTRNARTPTRGHRTSTPDSGQRTRGHHPRGHWTFTRTPDTGRVDAWTRPSTRTGRPRHGRHRTDIPDHHDHPLGRRTMDLWTAPAALGNDDGSATARRR